ncbi:MAG: 2-C-methyl-D-erythritol 4-phosphate cytidylyltransferase [bacterium]|nr:2-C-methyl-D-erythritol 4-phosphate cytidylyltransferase [bacterium]
MPGSYGIVLAGGVGARMGSDIPKQFLEVLNKPIIVYTLEAFQNHSTIDGIIVVIHRDHIDKIEHFKEQYKLSKILSVIPGGETRQDSSFNALSGFSFAPDDVLLLHDAVRPFITDEIISRCIEETRTNGAVGVCVNTNDTIFRSDPHGMIDSIPDRDMLRNAQTPQGFRYKIIKDSHEYARANNFAQSTDDIRLVLNNNNRVKIIPGSYENIKITTPNDLVFAEAIISGRQKTPAPVLRKVPSTSGDTFSIQAKSITKRFGRAPLFKNIDISLKSGSSLSITGSNGTGKSTLMQIFAGIQVPSAGSMEYRHNDQPLSLSERINLTGFISPLVNPYEGLSGFENIEFAIKKPVKEKLGDSGINAFLEQFGLLKHKNKHLRYYSSGMKQRLKFILAVINEPPILFLDEPGSNLDRNGKDIIYSYIDSIREKTILIIATNEPEEAKLCKENINLGC